MVSIKHGTILHGVDSARPIAHEPIVHENNRAPYRLDTPPIQHRLDCVRNSYAKTIGHQIDCARIGYAKTIRCRLDCARNGYARTIRHRLDCARTGSAKTIRHWLDCARIGYTKTIRHRFKFARIGYAKMIQHQLDCALLQLCTSEYKKNCLVKSHFFLTTPVKLASGDPIFCKNS